MLYAHVAVGTSLWVSAAATPSLACPQLAEPRACAASQNGGVLYMKGDADSAIAVTISNGVITNCSAVAEGYAVRARHAAQRRPSLGGAGGRQAWGVRVACGVGVRMRLARQGRGMQTHAA